MARPEGFEPPTTWFEARYVHLQYDPKKSQIMPHLVVI